MKHRLYVREYGNFPYSIPGDKVDLVLALAEGETAIAQDLKILDLLNEYVIDQLDDLEDNETAYTRFERDDKIKQINKTFEKLRQHVIQLSSNSRIIIGI